MFKNASSVKHLGFFGYFPPTLLTKMVTAHSYEIKKLDAQLRIKLAYQEFP